MQQETQVCDFCDQEFQWSYGDVFDSCDTVDGQFVQFSAVRCPHCECTNRV